MWTYIIAFIVTSFGAVVISAAALRTLIPLKQSLDSTRSPLTSKNGRESNDIYLSQQTRGWKLYKNTDFGFEVKYPQTLEPPEETRITRSASFTAATVVSWRPHIRPDDPQNPPEFSVSVVRLPSQMTTEETCASIVLTNGTPSLWCHSSGEMAEGDTYRFSHLEQCKQNLEYDIDVGIQNDSAVIKDPYTILRLMAETFRCF